MVWMMIDWDRVAELREEIGPEDFMEVVELFLDEVEGVLQRLCAGPPQAAPDAPPDAPPDAQADARADARAETLAEDLHFLKGSALNLGFARFGAMCGEAEREAAGGNPQAVAIAAIVSCYEASRQSFLGSDLVRAVA